MTTIMLWGGSSHIRSSFSSIGFEMMVGVNRGAPSTKNDIRLGVVVFIIPDKTSRRVIQYESIDIFQQGRFVGTGC